MTAKTRESQRLRHAAALVDAFVGRQPVEQRQEARFQLLEAVASRLGGFELDVYQAAFDVSPIANIDTVLKAARWVVEAIRDSDVPPALAVSALAREALQKADKRRSGAYHTDFRLARHLAASINVRVKLGAKVVDPACGAGILLTAVTLAVCGADRRLTSEWLARSVYAADLTEAALRGTLIALACLTDDVPALVTMRARWRVQDSLLAGPESWISEAKDGFDLVVANPPWEKIKLSRHEFILSEGGDRHYGANYADYDASEYARRRTSAETYGARLAALYPSLGGGEPDLYVAFTELLLGLTKDGGSAALLLPAGLIRSQGTQRLRETLLDQSSEIGVQVFDNRARFFEIDTRFKFLLVTMTKRQTVARQSPVVLSSATGTADRIDVGPPVRIGRAALARLRPDLSLPEVRSDAEWRLFTRMTEAGIDWTDPGSPWHPAFSREVDMTRERPLFSTRSDEGALPVVEGRMVHQHRFGAKRYVRGTGRSAEWAVNSPGAACIASQFYLERSSIPSRAAVRTGQLRAGFCDITGQTNERSTLAAIIPPGVVCGNKVPTLTFPNEPSEDRLWLWVALVNSFAFDWMIRRIITTTINYFHLLSLPLPPIEPESLPGRALIEIARTLADLDHAGATRAVHRRMAELRAKADHLVLNAFGLGAQDLETLLEDFPLIDGAQPPLDGETRSTITRDMILAQHRDTRIASPARYRVESAAALGAQAYMPSQTSRADRGSLEGDLVHG